MEVHIGKSELYVDAQKIVSDINISIPAENNNEILINQRGEKLQTINNVVVPGIVQTDLESITIVSKSEV